MDNVFDLLKKMNLDDIANNTRNLALSNSLISLNKVSGGFEVKMGVSHAAGMDLFSEKCMPIIMVIDKEEYNRLKEESKKEVING